MCMLPLALVVELPVQKSFASNASVTRSDHGFRVVDNEFVAPDGRPYIPYGFVLYCLALASLNCEHSTRDEPNTDIDRIRTAATFWHANAVRIQVAPEHLFSSSPYNWSYLQTLDGEVKLANQLGMVAIVTLQTEEYDGPPLPTSSALTFWTFMARHYKHNPMVFFDLYNEPRLTPRLGESWMWNLWRNGGTDEVKGQQERFVGMQHLVDQIRRTGAQNIIIAEGNQGDHDLSQLPQHLLIGSNVAYGIEPDLTPSDDSPAQWVANWANLAKSVPIAMEAFQDYPTAGVCNPQSPRLLPELLDYLQDNHLGLIVFSLNRGNLFVGDNMEDPTTFDGVTTYPCLGHAVTAGGSAATKKHQKQKHHHHGVQGGGSKAGTGTPGANSLDGSVGPGSAILAFFRANSHPVFVQAIPSPAQSPFTSGPSLWVIGMIVLVALALLAAIGRVFVRRRRKV